MAEEMEHKHFESFRPNKRRKFYRRRSDTPDESSVVAAPSAAAIPPQPLTVDELIAQNGPEELQLSVTEIVRQRKAAQRRRGGIEFANLNNSSSAVPQPSDALVETEDGVTADIKSVIDRFAPQTGQVSEAADKHMMAYIDSELAKRQQQSKISTADVSNNDQELSSTGALINAAQNRQPASLGKLHEIDLGPNATLLNIARTEAAQRRLDGLEEETNDASQKSTGKVRLRPNGKPYGPRRKRRNSEDIKRDKLVEEVMRESKLDIYDEPDAADEGQDEEEAADDRIAEQFRREFMEAISTRKQKTSTATAKPTGKGKVVDDRPKGPKLGGSRSARAAMREREEAAAAASKKKR